MPRCSRALVIILACSIAQCPVAVSAESALQQLPQGTRVYLELNQLVSGKRGDAEVGQKVRCAVWRDVIHNNVVFIKAGTAALCKVDKVSHANIAGIKGRLSIGALETTAVDGQTVQMEGGYMKEGKSRMALSISLAAIVFIPLIFIPGKAAELPEGTVFDAFTGPNLDISVNAAAPGSRVIDLSAVNSGLAVTVDYADLEAQDPPKVLRLKISTEGPLPNAFTIDSVNGEPIDKPLALVIASSNADSNGSAAVAEADIRALAKFFQKGINRFDVAYSGHDGRVAAEVVLNVQM
jgi:hypothetical protein